MKFTSLTAAVLGLAGMTAFTSAGAESFGSGYSLNPGGGYYFFNNDARIDDGEFPSIGLEYRFTDAIAAELTYLAGDTVEQANNLAVFDVEQLRLDGLYYFRTQQKLQPYLAAGVGSIQLEQVEKNIDIQDTIADVGAGVRYFFNNRFSLRGDLRAVNNIDQNYTDGLVNVSLNLVFGGEKESTEGEIDLGQAGAPANSDIGLDMDGDGVADYNDECLDTTEGYMVDANGCAIPVESTVSMDLNVNFAFESANLPPEFYSDVKELATFLKLYKDSEVTIEGHADSIGPEPYNQVLSERRAKAIRDILIRDFEVEQERLKIVGYGEVRPVATNETAEGRSKNRRAATVVTATRKSTAGEQK